MAKRSSRSISVGACFANVVLPLCFGIAIVVELSMLITRQARASPQVACPPQQPCPGLVALPGAEGALGASAAAPLAVTVGPSVTTAMRQRRPQFLSKDRGRSAANASKTAAVSGKQAQELPFYDLVALIFATGSEHDVLRMGAAVQTWLGWKPKDSWKFRYFFVLCADDPGLKCKASEAGCARANPNVTVVPCKHGYSTIVTKSTEGFRYLTHNYRFKYVLKADVDTMVEMGCIQNAVRNEAGRCPSFGMGAWRQARTSKVFTKQDPGAGKYPNEPFKDDSGMAFYPPYMVGWLSVWSADVAHYLGMAGLPASQMPKWKDSWTIDDAAIGTFVLGLDMCRLRVPCHVVTDVEYEQFQWHWEGDVTGHPLKIVHDGPVQDFQGPLRDDVPGIGDIADTWTDTLEACAKICRDNPECRTFEHSPTRGRRAGMKNCQIASGTMRTGRQVDDFSLYVKEAHLLTTVPDGPVDGFEGPLPDDVPGIGNLQNIFTETLEACAKMCSEAPACLSFEHSPTYRKSVHIKNCQLNSRADRAGTKFEDFSLYIKKR